MKLNYLLRVGVGDRGREAEAILTTGIRHRWVKDTCYYEVLLHQDLWGDWIVTCV